MKLRLKIILLAVIAIGATVTLAGYMGYRNSQKEIEKLAKELTKSKAEQAFSLVEHHYINAGGPSNELIEEIVAIRIAKDGYVFVVDNRAGHKGELLIHPSNKGLNLYQVPHVRKILDEINENGKAAGYGNFIRYAQFTAAKGRQSETKIGNFKYFRPWNCIVVAAGYESDIFASSIEVRNKTIFVIASVSLTAFLFVYLIIRQIFKPIKQLTDSTKEVAKGNWEIFMPYKSDDEIGILTKSFNDMIKSLRINARMWQEFEVARRMQISMLPESYPEMAGIRLSAKSIPATQVGGDFYDFLAFKQERLGIIVGDVSGHGLSSAMVMTAAMSMVKFAAEENNQTDRALEFANVRLKKQLRKNMFVALFYGIIDIQNQQILYTNAGQPSPLICRNGQVSFLPQHEQGDRFPLGIVHGCTYQQTAFDLKPGDTLLFYTDGILDATNTSGQFYDIDRFASSVQLHINLDTRVIIEGIVDDLNGYRGSTDLRDDVTLVAVRIE